MLKAVCVACLVVAQCLMVGCAGQDDPPPTFPVADACYRWGPSTVFFGSGQTDLSPATIKTLEYLVSTWRAGSGQFAIDGHADGAGSAAANRVLALARANKVKAYLLDAGVPAGSIRVQGHGDQRPLVQVPTAEPQNRRVEISLTDVKRDRCFEELIEPFDQWYARNCVPRAKLGQNESCESVRQNFPRRYR